MPTMKRKMEAPNNLHFTYNCLVTNYQAIIFKHL